MNFDKYIIRLMKSSKFAKGSLVKYLVKYHSKYLSPFIWIEPTNACNLDCNFCARKLSKKPIGFMDFNLFKKIINESVKYGRRWLIGLAKDGEPLLHKNIIKMCNYIKEKNATRVLEITTNAVLMDKEMSLNLIKAGVDDLRVSIDTASREKYKEMKGLDLLPVVEKNVEAFMKLKRELKVKKPFVRVKSIDMGDKEDIKNFKKRWTGISDWVETASLFQWGDKILNHNYPKRYMCNFPWFNQGINWNGDVSICCIDNGECVIGNVKDNSLYDLWHSEKLRKLRELHLNKEQDRIKSCKNCTVWSSEPNIEKWMLKNGRKF